MGQSLKKLMFVVIILMVLMVACQANVSDQPAGDDLFSLTRDSGTGAIFDNRKTQTPSPNPASTFTPSILSTNPRWLHQLTTTIESFNGAVESNLEFTFPNVFNRTIDMISSDTTALFIEKMTDLNHLGCIDISKEKWGWNN